jgi:Mrp family chromosome partitioning ATPase
MALESRIKVLNSQLDQIRTEAASVDEMEASILELQRKKQLEEANYRYFSASLEQARIDAALGAGRVTNIGRIQEPSPPVRDLSKSLKMVATVAIGGVLCGLAWAFLIELYLDRSVKRPTEFETKLGLPLFLSIPDVSRNGYGYRRLAHAAKPEPLLLKNGEGDAPPVAKNATSEENGRHQLETWSHHHPLRPFYEALRDRLVVYFEVRNLTHKPKLIAVTGLGKGSGVSTTAAGLAACLSETGDGNVLLVDMNLERGAACQFYKGKPVCGLDEALYTKDEALVQDKLYVVVEGSNGDKLPRALPKRFSQLVPKLKASDYDYIIFDMPPISQTSVTPRLAGFMDMVLLVIESEKTNRDIVQQAHALLGESKANVCAVLNKTRTYVPQRLHQEFLSDA